MITVYSGIVAYPIDVLFGCLLSSPQWLLMDHNRKWNYLAWNVMSMNSQAKWDAIRRKNMESRCAIVCLQETKHLSFDNMYLQKFCRQLDVFVVSPSVGGLVTIWNSGIFEGEVLLINSYSITMKFKSLLTGQIFHTANIYGHASSVDKAWFISWLYNFDCSFIDDWLLFGGFNLIRSLENRN
jgi:hypothetical protein